MLTGKNIVMGVTGGIAAWKACLILNKLVVDLHANVDVIMTKNSETFITEQTIRTLSRNIVTRDMFKEPAVWSVEHISLARKDCKRHCGRYAHHHGNGDPCAGGYCSGYE